MTRADARMPLVDHLQELRKRLMITIVGVVVCMVAMAVFNQEVFALLLHPLPDDMKEITTFAPTEPLMVSLKVWFFSALIVSSPILIYEFWAFVGPGFTPGERRHILPVAAICAILFLAGVAFGYMFVLPRGLTVLLNWNAEFFNVQNRAADYLSFAVWFLVAFGAVFELPVIIVALIGTGAVQRKTLARNRKYAVLLMAGLAAVATPSTDVFSMLAMFIPLLLLYEVALIVGRLFEPERRKRRAAARKARAKAKTEAAAAAEAELAQSVEVDGQDPEVIGTTD